MFLGSVIYDTRRNLNLTQSDLAKGLCNQNTISKMEKHNQTPQLDVLVEICKRLNLTLDSVFSDFSNDAKREKAFVLDIIEKQVLLDNLTDVQDKLDLISAEINQKDIPQYDLILGLLRFKQSEFEHSSFNLDKVLQETKSDDDNIYTLIAYLVKGLIYIQQNHSEMSDYYFEIILNSISENLNIQNADEIEILYICKSLGEAYISMGKSKIALDISKRGIDYANEKNVSYFIDELNYICALAMKDTDSEQYQEYKNIAYYCSILLKHDKLTKKIASL